MQGPQAAPYTFQEAPVGRRDPHGPNREMLHHSIVVGGRIDPDKALQFQNLRERDPERLQKMWASAADESTTDGRPAASRRVESGVRELSMLRSYCVLDSEPSAPMNVCWRAQSSPCSRRSTISTSSRSRRGVAS
ncbi:unnamed protein product [Tilletia caries]|uniref:Uncharacterized protein n=1 Tax=Tilletia caries TaxID=13290 RepID=A0A8T8TLB8_9BASI|nr:hypothetical protein A4X03_0g3086 [Tilletia caries]CAD6933484.1 unnamed protein product [Tilletia caries]CAD7061701.1 unnamed protein product [Tilletia caries]